MNGFAQKLGFTDVFVGHAHNNVLQLMAGTGIFGTLLFLSFSLYFLILALQIYRRFPVENTFARGLGLGIFAAQIHFQIGGMTECNFIDGEVNHMLVFLWATLLTLKSKMPNLEAEKLS